MESTHNPSGHTRETRNGLSAGRRAYASGMRLLLWLCAGLTCALLLFVVGYIFYRGIPFLSVEFLTTKESVLNGTDGILPAIGNTIYVILVTLLFALPLGVGAAVYLTEYAKNRRLVKLIEFAAETLSGIPSIIYALVGLLIFSQMLNLQKTLLAASLTLVIMNLPTIIRTTQESLKTVPQSYREGALGLGAGKWHTIRTVVLPNSIDGIVTGCILAIGRIVGESAVLLYIAGMGTTLNRFVQLMPNFPFVDLSGMVTSAGSTLTVMLYVYAKERSNFDLAFAVAVILILITLVINLCAGLVGKKLKKH